MSFLSFEDVSVDVVFVVAVHVVVLGFWLLLVVVAVVDLDPILLVVVMFLDDMCC